MSKVSQIAENFNSTVPGQDRYYDFHLVNIGEHRGPVLRANDLGVVAQLGRVCELGHEYIEGPEVGRLARDYFKLGFLKTNQ